MAVDNTLRMTRAAEDLARAAKTMASSQQQIAKALARLHHPAFRGREDSAVKVVFDDIATVFSFENPDIPATTQIYQQEDGLVRIEILVDPEDSARLLGLVETLPVQGLHIQAVDPE